MRTVILGLPKSGTTYLFSILVDAFADNSPIQIFEPASLDDQNILHHLDGRSWTQSEHMLIKILYGKESGWNSKTAHMAFAHYDKRIFLVRDPRDRMISSFFYQWYYQHLPDPHAFERAYQLTQTKEANPGSVPFYALYDMSPDDLSEWSESIRGNLNDLTQSINQLTNDGWFVLHYEDLVDKKWDALEAYVGTSLKREVSVHRSLQRVSRTQAHSNWRQWFTQGDVALFRPVFHDFLLNHGYDADDWELERHDSLPAAQGSAYMHRLYYYQEFKQSETMSWNVRMRKICSVYFSTFLERFKSFFR